MKKILIGLSFVPILSIAADFVNIINQDSSYIADKIEIPEPEPILDYSKQAWMNIHTAIKPEDLYPSVADGSSAIEESTAYDFNFGQKPFIGNNYGFTAYDINYDKTKWINCIVDLDNYCSPPNGNSATYNKSHPSGQYYFELTIKGNPIGPVVEFMGMFNINDPRYYSGVGASRVGNNDNGGYYYTNGDGTHNAANKGDKYKSSGITNSGTIMQVWVDYDTMSIAIMELGTNKIDYLNYMNK